MEEVLRQAPVGISDIKIKEIFENNDNNINKTLMELWEIPEEIKKEKTKWDDIRETCDAYDNEMSRLISNIRKNRINEE
jgi:Ca2+-binding EF-hand superfamily protein